MGGQLDGNFLSDSLPHKFILFVTLIICFVVKKFLSLSRKKVQDRRRVSITVDQGTKECRKLQKITQEIHFSTMQSSFANFKP